MTTAPNEIGAEITFRDVHAAYGAIEVVHGVDLSVQAGEVFAILGPNGAGKSTLLKVASGRMAPSSGELMLDGTSVKRFSPDRFAHQGICAIPEGRAIFPNLSVRENLQMWTFQGGVSFSQVEERSYARFPRLGERRSQLAGTLSGGEQQMLAIARALVGEPRLLLLDELSMGLAPLVVAELYDTVAEIAATGMTVIVVEQFATMALRVATRAGIMTRGRLRFEGSPEEAAERSLASYLSD